MAGRVTDAVLCPSHQIDEVLAAGLRTGDLNIGGGATVGCAAMGTAIAEKVVALARSS
jgi:hypothetical protein